MQVGSNIGEKVIKVSDSLVPLRGQSNGCRKCRSRIFPAYSACSKASW